MKVESFTTNQKGNFDNIAYQSKLFQFYMPNSLIAIIPFSIPSPNTVACFNQTINLECASILFIDSNAQSEPSYLPSDSVVVK